MEKVIAQVVKEYVMDVEGLDFVVKGRIVKFLNKEGREVFRWSISHHYKSSEKAITPYYPSKLTGDTLGEAEDLLLSYMKGFTAIGVTSNGYY